MQCFHRNFLKILREMAGGKTRFRHGFLCPPNRHSAEGGTRSAPSRKPCCTMSILLIFPTAPFPVAYGRPPPPAIAAAPPRHPIRHAGTARAGPV